MSEADNEVLECARYGEPEDLRSLLEEGANVNHVDYAGNTALHRGNACSKCKNNTEITQLMTCILFIWHSGCERGGGMLAGIAAIQRGVHIQQQRKHTFA